jgi:hypothetical protein
MHGETWARLPAEENSDGRIRFVPPCPGANFAVEALERRVLLSAFQLGSVLSITFDGASETISVGANAGNITATQNGNTQTFSGVTGIQVTGGPSNDVLNINGNIIAPLSFSNGQSIAVNMSAGESAIVAAGNSGAGIQNVDLGSLSIGSGATFVLGQSDTFSDRTVLTVDNFAIAGTLDLIDNEMIIQYGSGPDPISQIEAPLVSGSNAGDWNGTGIVSSAVAGADAGFQGATFAVGSVDGLVAGQIELLPTLIGDNNLDGEVNLTDLLGLLNNYGQTGALWSQGDINYDGVVNLIDLLQTLNTFGQNEPVPLIAGPAVATAASASPATVTGTSTNLSVLGSDARGQSGLIYTWQAINNPPAPVAFSANGTNAAQDTTVTFAAAGTYQLQATIQDSAGLSVTSTVNVTVNTALAGIKVSPPSLSLADSLSYTFSATADDQFGNPLSTQPGVKWSVNPGGVGGTITAAGVYTAPASGFGTDIVVASVGLISGSGAVTVTTNGVLGGDQDIGSPAQAGSFSYDMPSDTYTLAGSGDGVGNGIGSVADQLNFASTSYSGNGTVIGYLNSITGASPAPQAGVMFRNDNTPGSAFAAIVITPGTGVMFEWRSSAGAATGSQQISGTVGAPVGLKLTRSGNSFTGYYSTDGINWISIGLSQTIALNTTLLGGLFSSSGNNGAPSVASFSSVAVSASPPPGAGIYSTSDQLFLNDLEEREFNYFWDETNPNTGLVPDNANANGGNPSESSIAAIGFGLSALTIGDQRGWVSNTAAYQRALTTVNFLYNSGASYNGFFYHFLNPTTGAREGTSELSPLDTAELMSGVLTVAQYWAGTALQTAALNLYDRVNWPWMQQSNGQFYGQWTPENGFQYGYSDFSEAALLYLMGMGSPTHPTSASSWDSWSRTPVVNYDGYTFVTADDAALFTEQYPQAWFDVEGMKDNTGLNFYANSQTATLAQRQMFINLSSKFPDYSANLWGITPSDGPNGYTVWGGPPASSNIDGTVVPTAAGGSLEFEPRLAIDTLEYMKQTYGSTVYEKYGLTDAFNPLTGWVSPSVLGIDLGMTLISAENSRSNFVWNVFMQNPAAQLAISKAGFVAV